MRTAYVLVVLFVIGCSSNSSSSGGGANPNGSGTQFGSQFCMKLMGCGQMTPTNCSSVYAAFVLTSSCQTEILNASCGDLTATVVPDSLKNCLPSCTGSAKTCNSNGTLTECTGSTSVTVSCTAACSTASLTFTGTCASSYMGQASSTGTDQCWCK